MSWNLKDFEPFRLTEEDLEALMKMIPTPEDLAKLAREAEEAYQVLLEGNSER